MARKHHVAALTATAIAVMTLTGFAPPEREVATPTSSADSTSAAGTCGSPPYGAGNWPPACYRFFDSASPFNTPLPTDRASLLQHSQLAVSGPIQHPQVGNLSADPAGGGGEGVYYAQPTDPVFTLSCVHDEFGRADHTCPVDGVQLHVPAHARPEANLAIVVGQPRSYDAHLIVVDEAAGWEYDLWQVQSTSSFDSLGPDGRTVTAGLSASGGRIDFSWGGRIRLSGNGTSVSRPAGDPVDDANAAHWGETAGRVRAEELAAGSIDHALSLNLQCTANVPSVFPADPSGRARPCSSTVTSELGAHPLGTRFWLDMSSQDIDQLPVPDWKKVFLRALATYGGFVGDTNTSKDRLFYIETEGGNMYSSLSDTAGQPYPDRWYDYAGQQGWPVCTASDCIPGVRVGKLYREPPTDTYDWATNIWSKLRVVDPCVTAPSGQAACI
jgi:hypothetical protein